MHGDLAARNVLLAKNNVVKICDFGLGRKDYFYQKIARYQKQAEAFLPINWMAIESIRDLTFSIQSDVWSYGVTLWELFTLAKTPYWDLTPDMVYKKLTEGYRLEHPEYATIEMYFQLYFLDSLRFFFFFLTTHIA